MTILLPTSPALSAPALQWIKMFPPSCFAWSMACQRGVQKEDKDRTLLSGTSRVMALVTGNRIQFGMF